jgi:hypothetical protein
VLLLSIFLVVGVHPSSLLINRLSHLDVAVLSGYLSLSELVFSIGNYLLATNSFLLDGIGSLLLLLLLFHHLLLPELLGSLEVDLVNLVRMVLEAFEVVGLDSVRSKHANFGGWVFTKNIMVVPVFKFDFILMSPLFVSCGICCLLLLGENAIDLLSVQLVLMSLLIMLGLCFSEDLVLPNGLLVEQLVNRLFKLLLLGFLSDLLLTPILLL